MFLKQAAALLRGNTTEITLRLTRSDQGLVLVVVPKLGELNADEPDERKRILQGALARPFRVVIGPDADPDAAFADALAQLAEARAPLTDAYAALKEQANEALQQSRAAKPPPGKATTPKKTDKPAPNAPPPDAANATPTTDAAAPVPSPAVAAPVAETANLFE